jgi:hypothetical protein
MRFLADKNVSRLVVERLRADGQRSLRFRRRTPVFLIPRFWSWQG